MANLSRTNLWSFNIYPGDSAPDNYIELIQSWHIPALVSPLHHPDEEEKKDHLHIMLYFGQGQKKSYEQVMDYVHILNGAPAFRVESRNAMVRYFIHRDNPEKEQFEESDLICLSGFEIGDAFGSFVIDEKYYQYLEDLIIQHSIVNMGDLIIFLKETNCLSELSFLRRHTYYFDRMLDGMYRRLKKIKKNENEF